jgi:hypothetical protein
MSEVLGADADALDRVSVSVDQVVRHLDGPTRRLNGSIHGSPWSGRNADLFRRKWDSEYWHSIRLASEFLKEASTDLRRNAQQQRDASAAGGVALADSGQRDSASGFIEMLRAIKRYLERRRGDPINKPLFENGADPRDIDQGKAGDCWLLAGLGSIVSTPAGKEWIKKVITDNGDGTYTVHFKDGQDVVVNNVRDGRASHTGDDKWAFIIEKAYAQREGGFQSDKFSNGPGKGSTSNVLFDSLGLPNSGSKDINQFQTDSQLRSFLSSGKVVVGSAKLGPDGPPGIPYAGNPGSHAFSVIDSTSNSVTLRNPWGDNNKLDLPRVGATDNHDGTFTVSLAEFRKIFHAVRFADAP